MPTTRKLNAVLTATETVSKSLDRISDALEEITTDGSSAKAAVEKVEGANESLAASASTTSAALSNEGSKMGSVGKSALAAAKAKDAMAEANMALGAAAGATAQMLGDERSTMTQLAFTSNTAAEFVGKLVKANLIAASSADALEEQLEDLSFAEIKAGAAAGTLVPALKQIEHSMKQVKRETVEATTALEIFGGGAMATSLNVGPFNFALKNLLTTLPMLVMAVGSLGSVLLGVASAALAAAVGLTAILGVGLLVWAQSLADEMSDVEDMMEAIEEIMSQVKDMFIEALEPLANTKSVKMMKNAITGLASVVNVLAQSIASVQDLLGDWQGELSTIFFENFSELGHSVERMLQDLLPVLSDMFRWIMTKLPGAFDYFSKITLEFLPHLAQFTDQIMEFFRVFTDFGVDAFKGLLPVISGVLAILSGLVSIINKLPGPLVSVGVALLALTVILGKTIDLADKLNDVWDLMKENVSAARGATAKLSAAMKSLGGPFKTVGKQIDAMAMKTNRLKTSLLSLATAPVKTSKAFAGGLLGYGMAENGQFRKAGQFRSKSLSKTVGMGTKKKGLNALGIDDTDSGMRGMGGQFTNPLQESIKIVKSKLKGLKDSITGAIGSMWKLVKSAAAGAAALLRKAAATAYATYQTVAHAIAEKGLIGALWGAVAGLWAKVTALFGVSSASGVASAAVLVLAAALSSIGWTQIVVGITALALGAGIAAGALGHMGKEGSILTGIMSSLKALMGFIFDLVITVGVPVFNALVDGFEMIAAFGSVINQVLGFVAQKLGLMGKNGNFLKMVLGAVAMALSHMAESLGWVAEQAGKIFDAVTEALKKFGFDIEQDKFEGAKISEDDVRAGADMVGKDKKDAQGATAKGRGETHNTYEKHEYNFGDFNMAPEEKARTKRLVKDAMKEANRNRRYRDGGA